MLNHNSDQAQARPLDQILDDRPLSAVQWRVLLLGAFIMFMDGYDMLTMALATPFIAADWDIPLQNLGIAMALTMVGVGIGGLFIAPLSDRLGRKPFAVGALLIIGLGSMASALAPNMAALASARLVTGIGLGVSIPVAYALIADFMPPGRRSLLLTCAYCNVAIGSVAASLTGAWLLELVGWKSLFVIGGVAPLASAVALLFVLPESVRFLMRKRPTDPRLPALLRKLSPDEPVQPTAQEDQPRRQGSVRGLLAPEYRARTLLLWAIFTAVSVGQHFVMNWLPSVLKLADWGTSATMWGVATYQIGALLGGLVLARAIDRHSPTAILASVFGACAVLVLLFAVLPATPPVWLPLIFGVGIGIGGTTFAVVAMVAMVYPSGLLAAGIGWTGSVGRVGSIAGPLVGSLAIAAGLSGASMLTMLVLPASAAALLMVAMHRIGIGRSVGAGASASAPAAKSATGVGRA